MDANGIISGYLVTLTLGVNIQSTENVTSDTREVVFDNLNPFTNYTATVRAITGTDMILGNIADEEFTTSIGSKCTVVPGS